MAQDSTGRKVMTQGRIVWISGDLFKGSMQTDDAGRPKMSDKTGEQIIQYGFGLAIPKSILNQVGPGEPGEIWAAMHEETYQLYPSRQLPPDYAWKYKDGDGVDHNGAPFATREGYAGCIVLACTTYIPIKFFRFENGQNFQINEGIKCGDYVNVQLDIKAHGPVGRGKAGLYVNPNAVQFLGFGKEIINTPSGDQMFGNKAPVLPPGASATPIAPAGFLVPTGAPAMPPGFGGQPAYGQPPQPMAPQAPAAPHYGVVPQAPAAPHYGVVPQQFQPPGFGGQPQMGNAPVPQQFAPPAAPPMGQQAVQPAYPSNPFPGAQMPQAPMGQVAGFPGYPTPR